MRSALSLSLVLLATLCGHAASACELAGAHHPLRLLMSAGVQHDQHTAAAELSFELDSPASASAELRKAAPACTYGEPSSEPASRSYENALVVGLPSRGP